MDCKYWKCLFRSKLYCVQWELFWGNISRFSVFKSSYSSCCFMGKPCKKNPPKTFQIVLISSHSFSVFFLTDILRHWPVMKAWLVSSDFPIFLPSCVQYAAQLYCFSPCKYVPECIKHNIQLTKAQSDKLVLKNKNL